MPLLLFPFLRDLGNALEGFPTPGAPPFALYQDFGDALAVMSDTATDEDIEPDVGRTVRKNLINAAGLFYGAPAAQVNKVIDAAILLMEQETTPMDTIRIMIKGVNQEERKALGER